MGASISVVFYFLSLLKARGEREDGEWKNLTKPNTGHPHVFYYFLHFFTIQLILEQHRSELYQSIYTFFFQYSTLP